MGNDAKMEVKLIDYAQSPLKKLYAAFRTCYSADTPIEIWEKIDAGKISHEQIRTFIGERLKTGHASPLEQVVFWFAIAGVSRSLSHQFVRHRIGISFEQQSQRYVKFKGGAAESAKRGIRPRSMPGPCGCRAFRTSRRARPYAAARGRAGIWPSPPMTRHSSPSGSRHTSAEGRRRSRAARA